jgi:LuxR family maltose regulon positive regulatory protein
MSRTRVGVVDAASPGAPGLVARRELFDVLDRALSGRVTVVSAPPGSGKTFLLRSWLQQAEPGLRVAWVSLDRGESDAQRFWLSLVGSLRDGVGDNSFVEKLTPSPEFDGFALVEHLVSDLDSLDEQVVLVIDDLHELNSADALAQLELLLARLPHALHLVLVTRRDPPLPLGQLRLAGDLTEIRAADLRFTLEEARELLDAAGIQLSEGALATLHERTEGWVAGLRLAAIALAEHPDQEQFVAEFSGTERTVADYLLTEMLDRQPADVRTLLLRTSVLERVNGPLADLLTGGTGSERILQNLEEGNSFVAALDAGRSWFRYHQLFADLLRLLLRRADPGRVDELHQAAARWYADHAEIVDAVRHAHAAGDWPQASRLLAEHMPGLLLDGEGETLRALLAGFPPDAVSADPELASVFGADQITRGSLEGATAYFDLAERQAPRLPDDRRRRLKWTIAYGRLLVARRRGDLDGALDGGWADFLSEPQTPGEIEFGQKFGQKLRALALLNLGIVELWSGQAEAAEEHLEESLELARRLELAYVEVGSLAHLGAAGYIRSPALARGRCEFAIARAEAHGWRSEPIVGIALVTLGAIELWSGNFDTAENWLDRADQALRPEAEPATALLLRYARGLLHCGRGRHEQALREFSAADHAPTLFVPSQVLTLRTRGYLLQTRARLGDTAAARSAYAEMSDEDRRWGEAHAALAVIELAEGNAEAAAEAVAPVLEGTAPVTGASSLVDALLLDAIAQNQLADAQAVAVDIERALEVAEPDGLVLPFVMSGVRDLLERHPRHNTAHAALLTDILDVLGGSTSRRRQGERAPMVDELSDGELRVLRFLPSNLTAPEIGGELYVSPNTVKTHMRHIYAKLGVHRRTEAVDRARELGLVGPSVRRR